MFMPGLPVFEVPDHVILTLGESGDLAIRTLSKVLATPFGVCKEPYRTPVLYPLHDTSEVSQGNRSDQRCPPYTDSQANKQQNTRGGDVCSVLDTNCSFPLTKKAVDCSKNNDARKKESLIDEAMRNMQVHLGQISCMCGDYFDKCPTSKLDAADIRHCERFHNNPQYNLDNTRTCRPENGRQGFYQAEESSCSFESDDDAETTSVCDQQTLPKVYHEQCPPSPKKIQNLIHKLPFSKLNNMKKKQAEGSCSSDGSLRISASRKNQQKSGINDKRQVPGSKSCWGPCSEVFQSTSGSEHVSGDSETDGGGLTSAELKTASSQLISCTDKCLDYCDKYKCTRIINNRKIPTRQPDQYDKIIDDSKTKSSKNTGYKQHQAKLPTGKSHVTQAHLPKNASQGKLQPNSSSSGDRKWQAHLPKNASQEKLQTHLPKNTSPAPGKVQPNSSRSYDRKLQAPFQKDTSHRKLQPNSPSSDGRKLQTQLPKDTSPRRLQPKSPRRELDVKQQVPFNPKSVSHDRLQKEVHRRRPEAEEFDLTVESSPSTSSKESRCRSKETDLVNGKDDETQDLFTFTKVQVGNSESRKYDNTLKGFRTSSPGPGENTEKNADQLKRNGQTDMPKRKRPLVQGICNLSDSEIYECEINSTKFRPSLTLTNKSKQPDVQKRKEHITHNLCDRKEQGKNSKSVECEMHLTVLNQNDPELKNICERKMQDFLKVTGKCVTFSPRIDGKRSTELASSTTANDICSKVQSNLPDHTSPENCQPDPPNSCGRKLQANLPKTTSDATKLRPKTPSSGGRKLQAHLPKNTSPGKVQPKSLRREENNNNFWCRKFQNRDTELDEHEKLIQFLKSCSNPDGNKHNQSGSFIEKGHQEDSQFGRKRDLCIRDSQTKHGGVKKGYLSKGKRNQTESAFCRKGEPQRVKKRPETSPQESAHHKIEHSSKGRRCVTKGMKFDKNLQHEHQEPHSCASYRSESHPIKPANVKKKMGKSNNSDSGEPRASESSEYHYRNCLRDENNSNNMNKLKNSRVTFTTNSDTSSGKQKYSLANKSQTHDKVKVRVIQEPQSDLKTTLSAYSSSPSVEYLADSQPTNTKMVPTIQGLQILTKPGSYVINKIGKTKESHIVNVIPGHIASLHLQDL